jgi:hypothetical protein
VQDQGWRQVDAGLLRRCAVPDSQGRRRSDLEPPAARGERPPTSPVSRTSSDRRRLAHHGHGNDQSNQYPYYYKDGSPEKWNGEYFLQRFSTIAPPFKAGESLVFRDSIDVKQSRQAWQYLVGQRRVRRAPTVAYDTPDFVASGANYFDEVQGFLGHVDRFEWKLIGKREMYVPYNDNALVTAKVDEAYGAHHLNPDKLRWELHRVWEVKPPLPAASATRCPSASSTSTRTRGWCCWSMATTAKASSGAPAR